MKKKILFKGPAVKSELVVLMLDKWGLATEIEELTEPPDENDLDRDTQVLVGAADYERAHEILYAESEFDRAGF